MRSPATERFDNMCALPKILNLIGVEKLQQFFEVGAHRGFLVGALRGRPTPTLL